MEEISLSVLGLTIQCAGIILVASLSVFMTRTVRRAFLDYWAAAWLCLAVALVSLAIASRSAHGASIYFIAYFLGEYSFGFLFIAGCRNYAEGWTLDRRQWYWLIAGGTIAIILAKLILSFNAAFVPHAAILAGMFAIALRALHRARRQRPRSPGMTVTNVALALLSLDFLHYVPAMSYSVFFHGALPKNYLQYTSIYDLILEILLGFGTLMLVMEDARQEVEAANRKLQEAHDRLERQASIDPLTEALNRHAFYSLVGTQAAGAETGGGCAVILDIDNLKPINDSFGHGAGDAAIREVASAVRSAIRADDLLFRWGGDEFLILFFNLSERDSRERVARIDARLSESCGGDSAGAGGLMVSHGLATFRGVDEIERAIDAADAAMYASKQSRKQRQAAS
jgi:diguanylate cyclase (GGDEF)-like protein